MDVLAALGRLPEQQRAAVTIRYLQDLPYAEIAEAADWSEGTAKTLVRRGLARLRHLLIVEDPKEEGERG
jgi:RNA polymerase sigma-70 factor (ECF subfamily)